MTSAQRHALPARRDSEGVTLAKGLYIVSNIAGTRRKPCPVHVMLDVLRNGKSGVNEKMTMLEEVLSLGGVVVKVSEMSKWQRHYADNGIRDEVLRSARVSTDGTQAVRVPPAHNEAQALSTCHNSPQIEYRAGASLLRVKRTVKAKEEEAEEQGKTEKRGKIAGFSAKSRNRLMRTLASVKRDNLPIFVTLTFPADYPTIERAKRDLDAFLKRLARKFPEVAGVWKLEPQQRGAPHFHLLVWGAGYIELREFAPVAWCKVVGSSDPNHLAWHRGELGNSHSVQQIENQRGVFWYASKYMSKEVGSQYDWGRWWGVFYRDRLPMGELVNVEVTEEKAVQFIRYMRRYAHIKSRDYKSLTIICNSDFWLNKLL